MKAKAFTIFFIFLMLLFAPSINAKDDGIINKSTSGCSCHNGGEGNAEVTLNNLPNEYTPEQSYTLEIDVNGALSLVEQSIEALLIFVDAPSVEDQARRLRGRGDPEEEVKRRILEGEKERKIASELGALVVINDDLERAIEEISNLINMHR